MDALWNLSATELQQRIRQRQVSVREVAAAHCDRVEAVEPSVQAYIHFDRDRILKQADALDDKLAKGEPVGSLCGVPVAVKDILCAVGEKTTCASQILANFVAPYDAHVITKLRAADALFFGRLNMDEFAMGSSNETSSFHPTNNPWDLQRVPGGSSGGSAAAVAARFAPLAIGTDTGGSIRQPAGLCGVVGLKPTYGRVSRYGLVAFASSLDQIGPMTRTVEDAALLLQVLAGHDPRDSTCANEPVPDYSATVKQPLTDLKIGIVPEQFGQGLNPEIEQAVRAALKVYEDQGAKIVEVEQPHLRYAIATYYIVSTAEASSNLARYDGIHYGQRAAQYENLVDLYSTTRGQFFGSEVKRRILLGTFVLSAGYRDAYYVKALKVRRLIKQDFDKCFEQVDLLAGPVSPTIAFKRGEKLDDPLAMYLNDIYTVSANMAGIPGLSIPCGFSSEGLPIGLQLLAPPFGEETLLRAGQMYQMQTDWHHRLPTL